MATPLGKWVEEQAQLTKPAQIYWCDGTEKEAHRIIEIGMKKEKVLRERSFDSGRKQFLCRTALPRG